MAVKTANLTARIEPGLKANAEAILSKLGLSASSAISMFYNQIVLRNGIPFSVTLPDETRASVSTMSEEALNTELEKGYQDLLAGKSRSATEVFDEIYKE